MTKTSRFAAPENWVSQYGDMLYQYTLPRVSNPAIAEDIVQDTFLSALKGLEQFKGQASEKNWLFVILKNKIVDHYRKKASEQHIQSISAIENTAEDWFTEDGHWSPGKLPAAWTAPDATSEQKEIRHLIEHCKNHLKETQQQVFILKYMEDMKTEEICKVLNISSSNYWVLIHRARLQMRECLEKLWLKK